MADEMHFDTSLAYTAQIDADTSVKWDEITPEEQTWLYRSVLGRDPMPGEIENQIAMGKSVKFFVHGAKEELAARTKKGEKWAKKSLKYVNQWEDYVENTLFDSLADITGIDEFENPYGEIADLTGIKELEEILPLATSVAGAFLGPGAYLATTAVNSAMYGDLGDLANDVAWSYVSLKMPSTLASAAVSAARGAVRGDDIEDILKQAGASVAGGYLGDRFGGQSVIAGIDNATIIKTALNYAVNQDNRSALSVFATDYAYRAGRGETAAAKAQKSFLQWARGDLELARQTPGNLVPGWWPSFRDAVYDPMGLGPSVSKASKNIADRFRSLMPSRS